MKQAELEDQVGPGPMEEPVRQEGLPSLGQQSNREKLDSNW